MKTYNVFYNIKTNHIKINSLDINYIILILKIFSKNMLIYLTDFYLLQILIVSLKIKILCANTYKYRNKEWPIKELWAL